MDNSQRDQQIIEKFIQKETELIVEFSQDKDLVTFFANTLCSLKQNKTLIITLTGGPGSGKSTFVKNLLQQLGKMHIKADALTTEDFNLLDRKTRDRLIANGSSPLEFKDFQHLNEIIKKVREGHEVIAPKYDRKSGKAIVIGQRNFPHRIPGCLDFLIIEGDFQPIADPDVRIYFHVPTDIRMKNRIKRDLEKKALASSQDVADSFAFRLKSQYYPYTLPHHQFADMIVYISAVKSKNGKYAFDYFYKIHKRK